MRKAFGENARYIDRYLGDGNPATLYLTHYPGCISIYEPDPDVIDKFISIDTGPGSNFEVTGTQPIETTRLDDILPKIEADYIKIDVQGSELKILQNAANLLAEVSVIEMEAEFVAIYKDQSLFGDLQIYMRSQGFVFHKFINVASRCFKPSYFSENKLSGMSQMLWADAIFVKDFSTLENYSTPELLKTAYIMHDMYGSFEFAIHLLTEYDLREETTLGPQYIQKLSTYPELPKFLLNLKEFV